MRRYLGRHRVGQPIPAPDLAEFLRVQLAPLTAEAKAISRKREQMAVEKAQASVAAQCAALDRDLGRNRRLVTDVAAKARAYFNEPTPIFDALVGESAA